jgi:hypothetical protein
VQELLPPRIPQWDVGRAAHLEQDRRQRVVRLQIDGGLAAKAHSIEQNTKCADHEWNQYQSIDRWMDSSIIAKQWCDKIIFDGFEGNWHSPTWIG